MLQPAFDSAARGAAQFVPTRYGHKFTAPIPITGTHQRPSPPRPHPCRLRSSQPRLAGARARGDLRQRGPGRLARARLRRRRRPLFDHEVIGVKDLGYVRRVRLPLRDVDSYARVPGALGLGMHTHFYKTCSASRADSRERASTMAFVIGRSSPGPHVTTRCTNKRAGSYLPSPSSIARK